MKNRYGEFEVEETLQNYLREKNIKYVILYTPNYDHNLINSTPAFLEQIMNVVEKALTV